MTRYICSFDRDKNPRRMHQDGRPSDRVVYTFVFRLVPEDKIRQPDEARYVETRRITVEAEGIALDSLKIEHRGIRDAEVRLLYWLALKALERREKRTKLDLANADATIDLSCVVIPEEPFPLDLPGPVMGFRAPR